MSDLIGTIPYENVEKITATFNGGKPSSGPLRLLDKLKPELNVDYVETPTLEADPKKGDFVTLAVNVNELNQIYRVKAVGRNNGLKRVTLDGQPFANDADFNRVVLNDATLEGSQGQIFFGKRSGTGETGGLASQVLNTDFGKVAASIAGAVAVVMLIRYLIKE